MPGEHPKSLQGRIAAMRPLDVEYLRVPPDSSHQRVIARVQLVAQRPVTFRSIMGFDTKTSEPVALVEVTAV